MRREIEAETAAQRDEVEGSSGRLTEYLSSRRGKPGDTVVSVGRAEVGGTDIALIAGPCSVESEEQILRIAREVKRGGASMLRGGAFKPRTSPYDFQGLGKTALEYLAAAGREAGLEVVTEVMDGRDVELVCRYAGCLQIGSRNMQNYALLREVGQCQRPVLLKRGLSATYREFLMAAEYVLAAGNGQVILCERGVRAISDELRFTLDLNAVPYLKQRTHLPVIVDPSHGTGNASLVAPMSKAAIAAGADGIMVETHYSPGDSISDAAQTISTEDFACLVSQLSGLAALMGRRIPVMSTVS